MSLSSGFEFSFLPSRVGLSSLRQAGNTGRRRPAELLQRYLCPDTVRTCVGIRLGEFWGKQELLSVAATRHFIPGRRGYVNQFQNWPLMQFDLRRPSVMS